MSSHHQLENLVTAYGDAVQKGDAEAVARLFTEDAIVLPPKRPEFHGRQAIQDFYSSIMTGGWQEIVKIQDIQEDGETVFATGFRPDYSWLDVPVLDRKGQVRHDGGVVESPGMYLMGMQFLRRRKSALIDGAGDDARDLSGHLAAYLDG